MNQTDLIATYRAEYRGVVVKFMRDGTINYTTYGEISDEELGMILSAGGSDVPGFSNELS